MILWGPGSDGYLRESRTMENDVATCYGPTTPTFSPTPIIIRNGPSSRLAANPQGLKDEGSLSAAVPGQAYKSGGLTSGDGKPHSASIGVGGQVSPKDDR